MVYGKQVRESAGLLSETSPHTTEYQEEKP